MQKINLPKGTRDFSHKELQKRYYLIKIIKKNFENFGFIPIETPAFENTSIITGKYGEENEKLIFRILNSGNFIKKYVNTFDEKKDSIKNFFIEKKILPNISKKALRYDLTIPLARYVTINKNNINFPFKRYQIQPVWRADNPQKGRFREFYQCDADIIGSNSILQEIELIQLYDSIFSEFKLPVIIQINHRGFLISLIKEIGIENYWSVFINILDKWNKIGEEKVYKKLIKNGISENIINIFRDLFKEEKNFNYQLNKFYSFFSNSNSGKNSIDEIKFILDTFKELGIKNSELYFNPKLVRGLNYYTGIIYEVIPKINNITYSIGGGGRYNNLIKNFNTKGIPGIGISFGLDRIFLCMERFNLFDINKIKIDPIVLFINFGKNESLEAIKKINILRSKNIPSELYPEYVSLKKQFKYANKKEIYWIVFIRKEEINKKKILVKNIKDNSEMIYNSIYKFIKDYKKKEKNNNK